jgi:hypothetical protein
MIPDHYSFEYEDGRVARRNIDPGKGYAVWALEYEDPGLGKDGVTYENRVRIFFLTPEDERFVFDNQHPESLEEGVEMLEAAIRSDGLDADGRLASPSVMFPFR